MPPTTTLPEDPISLSEMGRLLGVAPCSAWRWAVRDGRVRAWRVGSRWRVSKAEALGLVSCNAPAPEALGRAELTARALETDAVLRREGVRR
jgi:enoyl-CoA hydratase/carnithine racemase